VSYVLTVSRRQIARIFDSMCALLFINFSRIFFNREECGICCTKFKEHVETRRTTCFLKPLIWVF
jgi:hypothetical protein